MTEKKFTFTYIPIEEVPIRPFTKWQKIFEAIPEGKALVFDETKSQGAARSSLIRFQQRGRFKDYSVSIRQGKLYILHSLPLKGEV